MMHHRPNPKTRKRRRKGMKMMTKTRDLKCHQSAHETSSPTHPKVSEGQGAQPSERRKRLGHRGVEMMRRKRKKSASTGSWGTWAQRGGHRPQRPHRPQRSDIEKMRIHIAISAKEHRHRRGFAAIVVWVCCGRGVGLLRS